MPPAATQSNRKQLAESSCGLLVLLGVATSAAAPEPGDSASYLAIHAPTVALRHVEIIDGTGAAPRADQTLVIVDGRIAAVGPAATTPIPRGALVRDYAGYTVLPGLVGMHDHLFYTASREPQRNSPGGVEPGFIVNEIPYSAPRLYLAAGVTTLRTTGSVEPYTDLKVRSRIESGAMPGPHLNLTAPYLEGPGTPFAQMNELANPEEARKFVDYWAGAGMSSFKAYMNITRAELAAAADAAHRRGLRITGHLCSVSWPEAIAAGIDDLEHGPVYTDTEFVAGPAKSFRLEMDFEHAFAVVGGLLLAGPDPTGAGGVLPGFGDQREIELLVEAGFTPLEAIRIGTENGARFLGREREIGTVAEGKRADLVLVHGDPAAHIADIENVEVVFKDGQGYDPQRLIAAVRGQVGIH